MSHKDSYPILTRSQRKLLDSQPKIEYDSESDEDYMPEDDDFNIEEDDYNSYHEESDDSLDEYGNIKGLIDYEMDNVELYEDEDEDDEEDEDEYDDDDDDDDEDEEDGDEDYECMLIDDFTNEDTEMVTNLLTKYIVNNINKKIRTEDMECVEEGAIDIPPRKKTKWYCEEHDRKDIIYFNKLSPEQKDSIIDLEKNIKSLNTSIVPLRFRILESGLDISVKANAIRKIESLKKMDISANEFHKIKNWVDGLLNVPFGIYKDIPINYTNTPEEIGEYLYNSQQYLNKAVYGHKNAKCHILQIISQWIANPKSVGNVLAIHGAMGIGKTTLVKEGISKALNKPYAFISLGGSTDSSYLEGHSYTYEGSQPGRIIEILKQAKCMNPIIYFDELDKVSETSKGEEIINLLIHLTDTSQNNHFQDKYYSGIDLDLSRCLFIFSYNVPERVNPILADRMYKIKLETFKLDDKVIICRDYLIPGICENFMIRPEDIIIEDDDIKYIVNNYAKEDGVRNLKRAMETIISKINVLKLTNNEHKLDLTYNVSNIDFPFKIGRDIIDTLVNKEPDDGPPPMMYS